MIKFLENAILVKIRARYAKRLYDNDYKMLLSCESVTDVAMYLKSKQLYSGSVSKMIREEVHREKLEEALMQSFFEDLSCLANYDLKFSKKIFRYILVRSEIKKIGRFLIFLKSGNSKSFHSALPRTLQSKSKINFSELCTVNTYGELLSKAIHSEYYKILCSCNENGDFDINIVETSLYNYLFDIFLSSICKFNFNSVRRIKKFLYNYVDIINVIRILRVRKIFNAPDDYISRIIFQFGDYKFSKSDLNESNLKEAFGHDVSSISDLEKLSKIIRFNWAKHNIRYSNIAEVMGISYVLLREIEIMNVMNIVEGVRYNLDRKKIEEMLIK